MTVISKSISAASRTAVQITPLVATPQRYILHVCLARRIEARSVVENGPTRRLVMTGSEGRGCAMGSNWALGVSSTRKSLLLINWNILFVEATSG